uniref:Uncharacterized protein n=1 Tax=Romanomermis culicivorax TaxID=13658 RepID=A0A915KCY3_ROMCU
MQASGQHPDPTTLKKTTQTEQMDGAVVQDAAAYSSSTLIHRTFHKCPTYYTEEWGEERAICTTVQNET